ncbi:peptide/nickel transport system permease protein [Sulfurivirga caldicuralii]|uniref:Peptide/nickel transport system permease protein n=1 Tax=Sulfurivirga caldicuralii TaxID=364032 RepID=A0A1N6F0Y1_9GAMM|nr:ABC transporter permease [Sulfurivirga caldicuralii]SIN88893.1 peptide/nickel transport system permease protein [Sulfurivirga caldicuralii]
MKRWLWQQRIWIGLLLAWLALALAALGVGDTAYRVDLPHLLAGPDANSWLGYDQLGRPVWERLLLGAQTSLQVALAVVLFSAVLGTTIGLLAGYYGGWLDRVLTGVIDVFLAFPGLLLAIGLAAVLGPGVENVIIALVVVGWVSYARLARAQTLSLRSREHVLAARALGAGTPRILLRHVVPLLLAPLGVEATFGIAGAVISEAGLSFLGLGIQPPQDSWGSMIREGTRYLLVAPHLVIAPGLALMAVVLAANRLGDAWRDYLDIKTRSGP